MCVAVEAVAASNLVMRDARLEVGATEQRTAALREEFRRVAAWVRILTGSLWIAGAGLFALGVCGAMDGLLVCGLCIAVMLLGGLCWKVLLPRWVECRGLISALSALPDDKREGILRPLRKASHTPMRGLESLMTRRLATELSASAAPDARGHEASPADGVR
jgi:hypothetical protein